MAGNDSFDHDLEAALDEETDLVKPELSGPSRIFRRPPRSSSVLSGTSRRSNRSIILKPIKLARLFPGASRLGTGLSQPGTPQVQPELIPFLRLDQRQTPHLVNAYNWFTSFIESKCTELWPLILSVVVFTKKPSSPPAAEDFAVVDHVLTVIAGMLSKRRNCAFAEIEDELINEELVKNSDERAVLRQLIFIFIGWLTMFYEPKQDSKAQELQIDRIAFKNSGEETRVKSRTFDVYTQQDIHIADYTVHQLLSQFGKLIPEPTLRHTANTAPSSEWIIAANVSYQTLRKVCQINIEWVGTLGMHLEFDSGRRVLKVFRFPSFCRLMYRYKQKGLLSQLFHDNTYDLLGEVSNEAATTSDFFRELLLTYRLIFSQDSSSHRLFVSDTMPRSRTKRRPYPRSLRSGGSPSAGSPPSRPLKPSIHHLSTSDPLLNILCSQSASSLPISAFYDEIAAPPAQAYYKPATFPFFAKKILALQGYVKEQNPHDWKTLWHDHRNKSNWWQFWAVLFIGGGTLILGILGLVLQIMQVVLAQQALNQTP